MLKMKTLVSFDSSLIAPCGMNCGSCLAYLREKNRCVGCRFHSDTKNKSCVQCIIINCERLAETGSGFCYDCEKFPCQRLKQLDKRYRTKYNTGLINNLLMIRDKGMASFLKFETKRRTCCYCGSVLSVHRDNCPTCNKQIALV
jgi:hypothetical protein